jgi:hypothetical protein
MAAAIDARKIARAAAEGVAIALAAREGPAIHGPFHIICGLPPEVIFDVTLHENQTGGFNVGSIEARRSE